MTVDDGTDTVSTMWDHSALWGLLYDPETNRLFNIETTGPELENKIYDTVCDSPVETGTRYLS